MKRLPLLLAVTIQVIACSKLMAQHQFLGIPRTVNYSKFTYKAGPQTWMITQAPNGYMYFANNDGLLEFDGLEWNLYKNLKVLNLAVLYHDGKIYVGGFNEFGYYKPDKNGNLEYYALSLKLKKHFDFGEIWKILEKDGVIYFQSNEGIYAYNEKKITIIKAPSRFDFAYEANNTIYINDSNKGLLILRNNRLYPIDPGRVLSTQQLSGVSELDGQRVLISTIDKGLYVYDGKCIKAWEIPISGDLKRYQINAETKIGGYHAFGTILNGLYIVDNEGRTILHVNQEKGLGNNTILSLNKDKDNNIWMGLNNGIAKLDFNSSLSFIGTPFMIQSVYASAVWKGSLYIGTNSGVYAIPWAKMLNPLKSESDFKFIPGTGGQVWSLDIIDNTLLCGHNNGVLEVGENSATKVEGLRGGWLFIPINEEKAKLLVGTYNGLSVIERSGSSWRLKNHIAGFWESARFIEVDSNKDIWVSHGYKGIYRLRPNADYTAFTKVDFFGKRSGLPSDKNNCILKLKGEIVASTEAGFYRYNNAQGRFVPLDNFCPLLSQNGWFSYVREDEGRNIWYVKNNRYGVLRLLEDGRYSDITKPFLQLAQRNIITFEHISMLPGGSALIGLEDGLAIYDPKVGRQEQVPYEVIIREISKGSQLYNLSFNKNIDVTLKNGKMPITFTAAAPFKSSLGIQFSFKLEGFDRDWSPWSDNNHKEYTNLNEGNYKILVKAKSVTGDISKPFEKSFEILPPWYRSPVAYLIYMVIFIAVVFYIKRFYDANIEKSRIIGEETQRKEFKEREEQLVQDALEAENEMIRLKNENLQEKMKRKERELALSTMHVIQKNELINKMKAELKKLQTSTSDTSIKAKTSDIIKKISKDIDNKSDWKTFELHFEQAHEEFIQRLKVRFPDLTSRELRLCVYLKMNMSSKEISTLMNISPRGVEISRYRVRKKMNLDRNTSLSEVLMDV